MSELRIVEAKAPENTPNLIHYIVLMESDGID